MHGTPQPHQRERALEALRHFGWNAMSFQGLERNFRYWFAPDGALVAYVDTGRAWVAAGAPITAERNLGAAARAFVAAAAHAGRRAVFFGTETRAAHLPGMKSFLLGEQPEWDPRDWEGVKRESASVRAQLRRAERQGVLLERLPAAAVHDPHSVQRLELEALVRGWLAGRRLPPLGFLVHVEPFTFAEERRFFVARQRGVAVGFASAVPVYARSGWFVEDLIRAPGAPNGTTEALVDAALSDAAALGSGYFTLGLAPLAGGVSKLLRLAGRWGAPLYDFAGLRAFKAKFRPQRWAPIYLTHPEERSAHASLFHALAAFAHGSVVRYGLEALIGGGATGRGITPSPANGPSTWSASARTRARISASEGSAFTAA